MRNIINVIIIALLLGVYSIAFWILETPFARVNYDSYTQLGHLRAWEDNEVINLEEGVFPDIFKLDFRTQYVVRGIAATANTFNIPGQFVLYFAGLIGLSFFIYGLNLFGKEFGLRRSERYAFIFFTLFSLGPNWTDFGYTFTLFSFPENLINGFYSQILAMGFLLTGIVVANKIINKTFVRYKFIFAITYLWVCIFVLVFLHLFTAGVFIILIAILLGTKAIDVNVLKYIKKEWKINLVISIVIFTSLLASGVISNFSWLSTIISNTKLLQDSPIALGTANGDYYSLTLRFSSIGLNLIGIVMLFSSKLKTFIKLWIITFSLISVSFVLPFTIPYFWRFTNFLRIPLAFALTLLLFRLLKDMRYNNLIKYAVIIFYLFASTRFIIEISYKYNNTEGLEFLSSISGSVILADPKDSNYIQSATSNKTVVIPLGHITSPDLIVETVKRLDKIRLFYEGDLSVLKELKDTYSIDYLLLNKKSESYNYITLAGLLRQKPLIENSYFLLYDIKTL